MVNDPEVGAVFGRLTDNCDERDICDIREVPAAVRCDVEDCDEHRGDDRIVRELDIVKREQDGDDPRHDEQPGTGTGQAAVVAGCMPP